MRLLAGAPEGRGRVTHNFRFEGAYAIVRFYDWVDAGSQIQPPAASLTYTNDFFSSAELVKAKAASCGDRRCAGAKCSKRRV